RTPGWSSPRAPACAPGRAPATPPRGGPSTLGAPKTAAAAVRSTARSAPRSDPRMPRSYKSTEVFLKGDPRYDNKLASKIINKLMLQGKKSIAQAMFYEALDTVLKKVENVDPVD